MRLAPAYKKPGEASSCSALESYQKSPSLTPELIDRNFKIPAGSPICCTGIILVARRCGVEPKTCFILYFLCELLVLGDSVRMIKARVTNPGCNLVRGGHWPDVRVTNLRCDLKSEISPTIMHYHCTALKHDRCCIASETVFTISTDGAFPLIVPSK